jgi:hypothetical protein
VPVGGIHTEEHRRKIAIANTRHGHFVDGVRSPTYNSWRAMKDRFLVSTHTKFAIYGGRGIKVCKRWLQFENFLTDMGERPKGTTIDRINNDGHYEPGNCRWSNGREQRLNQGREKIWLEFGADRRWMA